MSDGAKQVYWIFKPDQSDAMIPTKYKMQGILKFGKLQDELLHVSTKII
jgi:hypothetical protein